MLITIGICCYNAHDTIARSIRSAQAQTWPEIEIVVADDASSDGSATLVAALAQSDPRIRLVRRRTNGGTAATRNTILAHARGDYIAFLDDDDESAPDRTEKQIARLRQATDAAVCFVSRLVVKPGSAPVYSGAMGCASPVRGEAIALHILCGDSVASAGRTGAGTMMASAETFRMVGPFDETLRRCEEADWLVRLSQMGGEVVGCPEPLLTQHITSGADKSRDLERAAELAVRHKHRSFLRQHRAYLAAVLHVYQQEAYVRGRRQAARALALLKMVVRPRTGRQLIARVFARRSLILRRQGPPTGMPK